MKNALAYFALMTGLGAACAQDAAVRYVGTETVTISRCGTYNGVSTGPWWVAIDPAGDKGVSLKGNAGDGGDFSGNGELSGSTLKAKVSGINSMGAYWTGTIDATLDGDRLVGKNNGSIRGTSCIFLSEFDTRRAD